MTKYEALIAELEPYTTSKATIEKALADQFIEDPQSDYNAKEDFKPIARAAVSILQKLIVLNSDSLGKSSQSYNIEALKKRIASLCSRCDLDASEFVEVSSITDGSNFW